MKFKEYHSLINEEFENLEKFLLNPDYSHLELNQIESLFQQKGGKILGQGAFGKVYSHPSWNYVLKLFSDDPCYIRYVKFVMRSNNKHFPVFLDKPRKYLPSFKRPLHSEYVYAVRMEPLISLSMSGQEFDEWMSNIEQTNPSLERAIETVVGELNGCTMDFHKGNFMLRKKDRTYVITDPVATQWNKSSQYRRNEKRQEKGKESLLMSNEKAKATRLQGLKKFKKFDPNLVIPPRVDPFEPFFPSSETQRTTQQS
jgi:hypothetical protein